MGDPIGGPPGLRVVFLDDDARMRLALVRTAATFGVRATPVASAAALRAELAWCGADAAVLDFWLAGGATTTGLVEELHAAGFPVVVWTGDLDGARHAIGPVAPVVPKTADVAALFDAVVRVVGSPRGARCL